MADEDLDFIFCYGDYIYEGRGNPIYQSGAGPQDNTRVHLGGEVYSLDDYRRRYSQYTMDADLQASRASAAWFCTYDDHEVDNNWVGDIDQDDTPPEVFLLRRAARACRPIAGPSTAICWTSPSWTHASIARTSPAMTASTPPAPA